MPTLPTSDLSREIVDYEMRFGTRIPAWWRATENRAELAQRVRSSLKSGKPDEVLASSTEDQIAVNIR